MRKIAVVTGSRAEYGHLYWIIKGIHEEPELELQLVVTGMHLSPEFGLTAREIEKDNFPISEKVEMLLSSDTEEAVASSMGLGIIGFARAYNRLKPDIMIVLGDRFEIFSAVAAAVPFRIPVAHIHGGEITEGAIDELFRHAITKMSCFHFPATRVYAERIMQMGESPKRVFCFGAPGLDNISKLELLSKQELAQEMNLPEEKTWGIATYHPATMKKGAAEVQIKKILSAVSEFNEIHWIFTMPNADSESRIIIKSIKEYMQENSDKASAFSSLGQLKYLSLLKNAVVMIGNSSSGIIEGPSFELPVVNIGDRQNGRIRTKNVIDTPICKKNDIVNAINRAIHKDFKDSLKGLKNPYGDANTSAKIVSALKTISLSNRVNKNFYEISIEGMKHENKGAGNKIVRDIKTR